MAEPLPPPSASLSLTSLLGGASPWAGHPRATELTTAVAVFWSLPLFVLSASLLPYLAVVSGPALGVLLVLAYREAPPVALRSLALSLVFLAGQVLLEAGSWGLEWGLGRGLGSYAMALALFHWGEYAATAAWQPATVSLSSFLLQHSTAYTAAALASWAEFAVEALLCPVPKEAFLAVSWWPGLVAVLGGEALRKAAMRTAGRSFNHRVQTEKAHGHRLVTDGVYALCRHPAYAGWFAWAVGTQLLLGNPLCVVAYAVAARRFFTDRLEEEEEALVRFFGAEYVRYAERVPSGVPFVPGIRAPKETHQ